MNIENILADFNKFTLPKENFTIELDSLSEYIKNACISQSSQAKNKMATKQLQAQIEANAVTEENLLHELNGKECELRRMKHELRTLELLEENSKHEQETIHSAISYSHDDILAEKADEITIAASSIENRLGFKLKLTQNDNNESIWRCSFIFGPNNEANEQFITVDFDLINNKFTLINMKPKSRRFVLMSKFLDETNDITGFLHSYFQKYCAAN